MTKIQFSSYQKAIFLDTFKGTGHTIIEALAGSAKTTTLIESTKYIPKGKKVIALAFNKSIQKELSERVSSRTEALTFHSLGLRSIKQRFKTVEIDNNKIFNLIKDMGEVEKDDYDLISNLCDTVAHCKYSLTDAPSDIENLIWRFGIDTCGLEQEKFIRIVIKTLSADKAQIEKVDFDDMCWYNFVYDLPLGCYDYVLVDEFQDLNRAQMLMAKKLCNPKEGRIFVYGDSFQNLYSWRSSDITIINELKKEDGAKTLTLPITYRCPKKIVELVRPWVPNIMCPETAKEGSIEDICLVKMYEIAKPGSFILSRTNAPLIRICLSLIREGKKANIQGRDIGKQLSIIIKKSKKKQIPAFLKWLSKWKDDEVEKLQSKGIKPDTVLDKYECLVNLCEDAGSLEDVQKNITELFSDADEKNMIICSTVHRAKGRERDVVFLLRWTFRVWFNQMQELKDEGDEFNEEGNIIYVAGSRTRDKLYLVNKF